MVGVLLLAAKFWAYGQTNSKAVLSDALEGIVNVVAAIGSIVVIVISSKPADREHPYGHGKIEYFSAAFEGGLISFAAITIAIEAVGSLYRGNFVREIDFGLLVVIASGVGNALLGWYLIFTGKKYQSMALVAGGKHVLSDFWTTTGVVAGLIAVRFTGYHWIDAVAALFVSLQLGYTGFELVRESVGGLMDAEDMKVIEKLGDLFAKHIQQGIIRIHHTRVIRAGRVHHIDAHVVVPEFWGVAHAHEKTNDFEQKIFEEYPTGGELHLHLDPCRRAYCKICDLKECEIRREPFESRLPFTLEELTSPFEPEEFWPRDKVDRKVPI